MYPQIELCLFICVVAILIFEAHRFINERKKTSSEKSYPEKSNVIPLCSPQPEGLSPVLPPKEKKKNPIFITNERAVEIERELSTKNPHGVL